MIIALLIRSNPSAYHMLVWAVCVMMITEYVWRTRMHERYMVEAIAPLAILVGLWPRIRGLAFAIMLFQASSIGLSLVYWYGSPGADWLRNDVTMRISSLGIIVTWALLLRVGWMAQRGGDADDCLEMSSDPQEENDGSLKFSGFASR